MKFRFARWSRSLEGMTFPPHRSKRRACRPSLEELEPRLLLSGFQPTAVEQLFLEDLNDARANPTAYGQSIGVDLSYIAPSQPLAFSPQLIQAAQLHSQDMNDRGYFAHITPDGTTPQQRVAAAGFPAVYIGECLNAGGGPNGPDLDPASSLADLIIDSGVPDLGHRNILLSVFSSSNGEDQIGVGAVLNGGGPANNYYTIDTANTSDTRPFLTGVVFHDDNGNGKYDIGEGLPDVSITVQGVGAMETFNSGGYSLQVNPGTYTVTASGGGLAAPITQTVTVGNSNVRLNFIGPAEGSWNTAAALPTARADLAVVAGGDGRIYALGGADANSQPLATLEAYSPSDNRWTALANMPTPRADLAATVGMDGRIYAFGGQDASQKLLNTAEVYDPATNTWSNLTPMPDARASAAAVAGPDGRIYLIGGMGTTGLTDVVDVYSPQTNSWSTVASLPTMRSGLAAVLGPDGRIYALGGADSRGNPLNTVEVYNPATDTWTSAAAMPLARKSLAAVTGPDGRIYGLGGDGEENTLAAAVEVYTPASDSWSTLAGLLTPRTALGAAVGSDGRIYTVGGSATTVSNTVESLSVPTELAFAATIFSVTQGAGSATVTVVRTGNASGAATLQYTANSGTAVSGVDYTPVTGTLSFAAGQTFQQFTVPLLKAGGSGGPNKTILLTLSNPTGGAPLASPSVATIVLVGNGSFLTPPPGGGTPPLQPPPHPSSPFSPPSPPSSPPVLVLPPLLAFFDSLLGGTETVNANGTETLTYNIFGFPLFVSTFDHSGNLVSVDLFGSIDITFLFG